MHNRSARVIYQKQPISIYLCLFFIVLSFYACSEKTSDEKQVSSQHMSQDESDTNRDSFSIDQDYDGDYSADRKHYEIVMRYLKPLNNPVTIKEVAQATGLSEEEVQSAIDIAPVTPDMITVGDDKHFVVDKDFFDQKLSLSVAYSGNSILGQHRHMNTSLGAHQYVDIEMFNGGVKVLHDDTSKELLHGIKAQLMRFDKVSQSQDTITFKVDTDSLNSMRIVFPLGMYIKNIVVRGLRYLENPYLKEKYLSLEVSYYGLDKSTGASLVKHYNFCLFPRQNDDRVIDKDAVLKVLPLFDYSYDEGNFLLKGMNIKPTTYSPSKTIIFNVISYDYDFSSSVLEEKIYESIRDGVESWNIYKKNGSKLVEFRGLAPKGAKFGDYGYAFISMVKDAFPGSAYANVSYDINTGLITSSLVLLRSRSLLTNGQKRKLVGIEDIGKNGFDNTSESHISMGASMNNHVYNHDYTSRVSALQRVKRFFQKKATLFSEKDDLDEDREVDLVEQYPEYFDLQLSYFRMYVYHEVGHTLGMAHNFKDLPASYQDKPLTNMGYLDRIYSIGLFRDGLLSEPFVYDQAFIDLFYNHAKSQDIEVYPTCSHLRTWDRTLLRWHSLGTEVYDGIDPFCNQFHSFPSVSEGVRFLIERMDKDVDISGYKFKSFQSSLVKAVVDYSSNLGLSDDNSVSAVSELNREDKRVDGDAVSEENVVSGDGKFEALENSEDSEFLNVDLLKKIFFQEVQNYFYYSLPSLYDVITLSRVSMLKWMSYESLKKSATKDYTIRLQSKVYIGGFKAHETYLKYSSIFDDYTLTDFNDEELLKRAGLSRFSGPADYDAYYQKERKLMLGIFSDVVSISAGNLKELVVIPGSSNFSSIACKTDHFLDYFLDENHCLVEMNPVARQSMLEINHEFLQSFLNVINKIKHTFAAIFSNSGNPVEGEITSYVARNMLDIMENKIDISKLIMNFSNYDNDYRQKSMSGVMDIYSYLIDRSSFLDFKTFNEKKITSKRKIALALLEAMNKLEDCNVYFSQFEENRDREDKLVSIKKWLISYIQKFGRAKAKASEEGQEEAVSANSETCNFTTI
ncbi:MAG: hypothetical protein OXC44_07675 [Proteobacteria bacterium]|nr:hypothetical protein [Pseudomonadota bacterium]